MDGVCSHVELLASVESLKGWLLAAADFILMKVIDGPHVVDYPADVALESGLSGVLFVAESNITVHTYPEYDFAQVEVFSCKDFPIEATIQWIGESFGMRKPVIHMLTRPIVRRGLE